MNSSQQYYAQQARSDPLAGLRTDGHSFNPVFQQNNQPAGLNSSASPFTPSAPRQSHNRNSTSMQASLEDQLASMQLHAANQHQGGQYNRRDQAADHAARNAHLQQQQYLQLQQQLVQQQLAAKQQQMELLRLQALQQQNLHHQYQNQQQQQAAAAQQRFLLSRLQQQSSGNEYESQQYAMREAQASSAQEQRQAAQANIQANFRQRQAQQLYQSMGLDNRFPSPDNYGSDTTATPSQQQQQQQQQQQYHHSRQPSDGQLNARTPLDQRSWRGGATANWNRTSTPPVYRDGSPASSLHVRDGRPSSGIAESVSSARSRAMTPSIVIDDSASESSRAAFSDGDVAEGDQTPETSEEDMANNVALAKVLASQQNSGTRAAAPAMPAPKAVPRALSLAAAPTTRAFTREAKSLAAALTNSGGLTLPPIQPRRQPKGQPTEFKDLNFQARMKSRLRKEAMSKLCASPRAASFATGSSSFGSRLSSSPSIAPIP